MTNKEKLETLRDFYLRNRGVGHSKLLMDGYFDYRGEKTLLVKDKVDAERMKIREDKFTRVESMNNLSGLRTLKSPMIIDNHAVMDILNIALNEIEKLEEKHKDLIIKFNKLNLD